MLRPGMQPARISFVDSHTEGEPTRVVVAGAPAFAGRTVAEQAADFAANHDWFRSATVNEPRGNDVLVGAVLVPSADPAAAAGVIFYNNVGLLGMCGHGTIGVVRTLAHLGRVRPGVVRLETPVGTVEATLQFFRRPPSTVAPVNPDRAKIATYNTSAVDRAARLDQLLWLAPARELLLGGAVAQKIAATKEFYRP
jgi:hypothetical protein